MVTRLCRLALVVSFFLQSPSFGDAIAPLREVTNNSGVSTEGGRAAPLLIQSPSPVNLIENGDFENLAATGVPAFWKGGSGFVIHETGASGLNYGLCGQPLFQQIPTTIGQKYRLRFAVADYNHNSTSGGRLNIRWSTNLLSKDSLLTIPINQISTRNHVWEYVTLTNVADATSANIIFASDTVVGRIDDVSVVAVPNTPQPQTINWDMPAQLVITNSPYTLTATASSGEPITFSVLTGPAMVSGNQLTWTNAGSVVLRANQGGGNGYLPAFVDKQIQIVKAPNGLVWINPGNYPLHAGTTYALQVQTSHAEAPVIYTLTAGNAQLAGNLLTPAARGSLTVRVTQAGTAVYAALNAERVFMVDQPVSPSFTWITPQTDSVLTIGRTYPLQVQTSHTNAPITFSLLDGDAIVEGASLLPVSGTDLFLRIQQDGTEDFLPLDRTARFAVEDRLDPMFVWVSPAGMPLQVGQKYPIRIQTLQTNEPVRFRVVKGPALIENDVLTATNSGFLDIEVQQAGDAKYRAVFKHELLTAGFAQPRVTWVNPTNRAVLVVGQTYTVQAVSEAPDPPLTFSIDEGAAVLDGNQLTPTKPGSLLIFASQPGNVSRLPSGAYATFFVVEPDAGLIWDNPAGSKLDLNVAYPVGAHATNGRPVDFSVERGPAGIQNATVTVTNVGTVALRADQAGGTNGPGAPARHYFNASEIVLPHGRWPGYARGEAQSVRVVNDKIFVADGWAGLTIYEPGAPNRVNRIGGIDTPGYAFGVQVVNDRAYIADYDGGLQIIDVSDPTRPVQLGNFEASGQVWSVVVTNQIAFLSEASSGVEMVDVSNPTMPRRVGTIETEGSAWALAVADEHVHIAATGSGIEIYNISSLEKPVHVSTFPVVGRPVDILVSGGLAYVAALDEGLVLLDVANLSAPRKVGGLTSCSQADRVQLAGKIAYVADRANGLYIVDVSNPALPELLEQREAGVSISDVAIAGDNAYLAAAPLLIVEQLTEPSATVKDFSGSTFGLRVVGNRAYVADGSPGMQILDVADRDHPRLLSTRNTSGQTFGVDVLSNYAYLANGSAGVEVIDVRDPFQPGSGKYTPMRGTARAIKIQGKTAYLAGSEGLALFDLSIPDAPLLLGNLNELPYGATATDVAVDGTTVYLAGTGGTGFEIIDVSVPNQPRRVGAYHYFEASDIQALSVSGNIAFLASGDAGIEVLDISDRTYPKRIGGFATKGDSTMVKAAGNLLYAGDAKDGLLVLDVSDPTTPKLLERFQVPARIYGFEIAGDTAYIANGEWGVQVVELHPRTPQQIAFYFPSELTTSDGPWMLQAEASSGLPVEFAVISGPATIQGNTLVARGPGTVRIRARQAGDDRFLAASIEQQTVLSLPAQSITWIGPSGQYLAIGVPYSLAAQSSAGLPVHFRIQDGPASLNGSEVVLTNLGTVRIVAEQSGDASHAAVQLTRTFNVSEIRNESAGAWPGVRRGNAAGLDVAGKTVYVAAGALRIIDVSDPQAPVEQGHYAAVSAGAVQVIDQIAYIADRLGALKIVDVSTPTAPVELGRLELTDVPTELFVAAHVAYVTGAGGLRMVDVSDPKHPALLGLYPTDVPAQFVRVTQGVAYVAVGTRGLLILDVTKPEAPKLVAALDTPDNAHALEIAGDHVFVADGLGGLAVVDVTDRSRPAIVGTLRTSREALGLALSGTLALVADSQAGLLLIDISNPRAPKLSRTVFTAGTATDVRVGNGLAYVASSFPGGLEVIPLDGISLFPVGTFVTYGRAVDVKLSGNYAFLADSDAGVQVLKLNGAGTPSLATTIEVNCRAAAVQIQGDLLFVGAADLEIFDVSKPEDPRFVGSYQTDTGVQGVFVNGNRAYLSTYSSGLVVLDVSDPANPKPLGSFEFSSSHPFGYDLTVQGQTVFVANSSRVEIIDASHPENLKLIGEWIGNGFVASVTVAGNYLYVASSEGIVVLDIQNPSAPRQVGAANGTGSSERIWIDGQRAVVASDYGGLLTYDITDPSQPALVGSFFTIGSALSVQVVDGVAAVACDDAGFQLVSMRTGWHQELTFSLPRELSVGQEPLPLLASASSGLPVSFSVLRGPGAIEGGSLRILGAGDITVRAIQAGDANYLGASKDQTTTVRLLPQGITWIGTTNIQLDLNQAYTVSARADSGLPVTVQLKAGPAALNGTALVVTNFGAVVLSATQAGNSIYAPVEEERNFNAPVVGAREVGSWPGYARGRAQAVQVVGDYAFVAAAQGGLMIIDVSNPDVPRHVASVPLETVADNAVDVRVSDGIAYVADFNAGVFAIDVTTAARPVLLGKFSVSGGAWALDVSAGLVYAAAGGRDLAVVDFRKPREPQLLSIVPVRSADSIVVRDGWAFVASEVNGITIVDVHNAASPTIIAQAGTGVYASRVRLNGHFAYVLDDFEGFAVVDIRDPGAPRVVGRYTGGGVEDMQIIGAVAIVTGGNDLLAWLDLSDPAQPKRINRIPKTGTSGAGLGIIGNRAFVAAKSAGLLSFALTNIAGAEPRGSFQTDGFADDLEAKGSLVLLADNSGGMRVLDLANSQAPTVLGQFGAGGQISGVALSGNTAYVSDGPSGLHIVDIADSSKPTQLSSLALPGYASRLSAYGSRLAVACKQSGLSLIDASDPARPVLTATRPLPSWPFATQQSPDTIYVALGFGALQVFGTANLAAPNLIGTYAQPGEANDLALADDVVYLAQGTNGVQAVDVSRPDSPSALGALRLGGTGEGIEYADQMVYVADGPNGLSIVDVRDPSNPVRVARIAVPGHAQRVRVLGNRVLVAAGEAGLQIFELDAKRPQAIVSNLPDEIPLLTRPFQVSATASSGAPVSIRLIDGPATLQNNQLHPEALGTIHVRFEQSGDSHYFPVAIEAVTHVVPATPQTVVSAWFSEKHGVTVAEARGMLSDPDLDGIPNVLECLLASDPTQPGARDGRIPSGRIVAQNGETVWETSFALNEELAAVLNWQLETRLDWGSGQWLPVPTSAIQTASGRVTVTLPVRSATQFLRLRIQGL